MVKQKPSARRKVACQDHRVDHNEVVLIGGRSGAGKSTVGLEVSARLRVAQVAHAIIEGDFMGQIHPAPRDDPDRSTIVERNLTAVWHNFASLGYQRLIYTNSTSVLPSATAMFTRALGERVRIIRVLLTACDATASERLTRRELGSELNESLGASTLRARTLDEETSADALRVATDGRSVIDIANEVVAATGWLPAK